MERYICYKKTNFIYTQIDDIDDATMAVGVLYMEL